MSVAALLPWVVRASWAVLPFAAGPALAGALDPRSVPVRTVASAGLWAVWAAVLLATLVAHPLSLTALRAAAPAAVAAVVAAGVEGHLSALAVGAAVLATLVAYLPETAVPFVNGPAYPNERRFPLRVPGPLLLGPLPLAWALAVGGPVVAALLLAAEQWVAGGLAAVAAAPVTAVLARAIHSLSRRWVVFVPAGLVLHDPLSLADPVLFRRQTVAALEPAPAGSDALDLTQRALGLALQLTVVEPVPLALTKPGSRVGEPVRPDRMLFTPTRPGAVLAEARTRRLKVP